MREDAIYGAPDLVVEVLLPSNKNYDRLTKRQAYAANGVPEYWLVDPMTQRITVPPGEGGSPRLQAKPLGGPWGRSSDLSPRIRRPSFNRDLVPLGALHVSGSADAARREAPTFRWGWVSVLGLAGELYEEIATVSGDERIPSRVWPGLPVRAGELFAG